MEVGSPVNDAQENFISNLESTFSESLNLHDAPKYKHATEENDNCNVAGENLCGDINQKESQLMNKCLEKSATFPIPHLISPFSAPDVEPVTSVTESSSEHSAHQIYSRSVSLPAALNLKSAMKGGRERNGESLSKLTVKWAAGVYDPIPTLTSHTVKNRKQQKSRKKKPEKKNGKKSHKGSSTRGSSSKDKKQFRNHSIVHSDSDLSYKTVEYENIEASSQLDALGARSQDSYCGTSFLKNSVTEVHYSVAEAQ